MAKVNKDQLKKKIIILTWLPFVWKSPWQGDSGKQNQHGDSLAVILRLTSLWGRRKGSRFAGVNTIPPTARGASTKYDQSLETTESRTVCRSCFSTSSDFP